MKKKFNWVDIVIIGVLFGIVYIGYSFIMRPRNGSTDEVAIEIVYRSQGLLMESVNSIKEGDIFMDTNTNQVIGKVIDKEVKESYEFVETGEGRIIKSRNPNKFDVYMTMRGQGIVTDDYIRIGDREMRIEATIDLKSKISSVTSTITDIQVLE